MNKDKDSVYIKHILECIKQIKDYSISFLTIN